MAVSDTLIKDLFLASLTFSDSLCIKRYKLVLLPLQVSEPVSIDTRDTHMM